MDLDIFFTPEGAAEEIIRRRKDLELIQAVNDFLEGDIPDHFNGPSPISYLCRHVATPNYETLRFVEIAQPLAFPMVIGQDLSDLFVSSNRLKRALGKLPVTKHVTRQGTETIENLTVIDFGDAQSVPFRDITTLKGRNIAEFHTQLFRQIYPERVSIIDESDWISRHGRGHIIKHYEQLLSLLIVHGVMFEFYEDDEKKFVDEVLIPAQTAVIQRFGAKPLIVNLVDDTVSGLRDWNSYPSILFKFIKDETL